MLDLVFVRVGKTGSSSLSLALRNHYGAAATLFDASPDFAVAEQRERHRNSGAARLQKNTRFVHGHVRASDYVDVPSRLKITFLRDPIARLASHHAFWLTQIDGAHGEREMLQQHEWSLLEFAERPRVQQLYTEHYFGGVDMQMFDFIGCFERFERDYARVAGLVGAQLPVRHDLPNPNPAYAASKAELASNPALVTELRRVLADEYEFYERWSARDAHQP